MYKTWYENGFLVKLRTCSEMLRVAICKSGAFLSRMHRNWFAPDTGFPIEWRVSTRPSLNPPFSRLLVPFSICPAFSRSRELPPSFLSSFIFCRTHLYAWFERLKEWTIVWSIRGATCNVADATIYRAFDYLDYFRHDSSIETKEKKTERERAKVWQVRLLSFNVKKFREN